MQNIVRLNKDSPFKPDYLSIKKLREWDWPMHKAFNYDDVTDEQIAAALADQDNLDRVDVKKDWECDGFLNSRFGFGEQTTHIYRIAAIAKSLINNPILNMPIEFDTFCGDDYGFCVHNGHHRIRAAEFIGLDVLPFSLSGYIEILDDLIEFAGYQEASPSPFAMS